MSRSSFCFTAALACLAVGAAGLGANVQGDVITVTKRLRPGEPVVVQTDVHNLVRISCDEATFPLYADEQTSTEVRNWGYEYTGRELLEGKFEKNFFISEKELAISPFYSEINTITSFKQGKLYYLQTESPLTLTCATGLTAGFACGNGIVEGAEACDDGDTVSNDGCSSTCAVEISWYCEGSPSVCMNIIPTTPGGDEEDEDEEDNDDEENGVDTGSGTVQEDVDTPVIGAVQYIADNTLVGWACDPDTPDEATRIQLQLAFEDSTQGAFGLLQELAQGFLTDDWRRTEEARNARWTASADTFNTDAIATCGNGNHGFSVHLPSAFGSFDIPGGYTVEDVDSFRIVAIDQNSGSGITLGPPLIPFRYNTPWNSECADGIDNDSDGLMDRQDTACKASNGGAEQYGGVIGNLEAAGSGAFTVTGWTCDRAATSDILRAELYVNGPNGSGGTLIGSAMADLQREAAVGEQCGAEARGFTIDIPVQYHDGVPRTYYAYGLNTEQGHDALLEGSPITAAFGTAPVCGDGIVMASEQCDDGNDDDTDACRNTCVAPRCGDGVVQSFLLEECDDGNDARGDGCFRCKAEVCGNGRLDAGEDCDTYGVTTDTCTAACTGRIYLTCEERLYTFAAPSISGPCAGVSDAGICSNDDVLLEDLTLSYVPGYPRSAFFETRGDTVVIRGNATGIGDSAGVIVTATTDLPGSTVNFADIVPAGDDGSFEVRVSVGNQEDATTPMPATFTATVALQVRDGGSNANRMVTTDRRVLTISVACGNEG